MARLPNDIDDAAGGMSEILACSAPRLAISIDPYPSPPKIPDPRRADLPAFFELRSPEVDGASATSEGLLTRLGYCTVSTDIDVVEYNHM